VGGGQATEPLRWDREADRRREQGGGPATGAGRRTGSGSEAADRRPKRERTGEPMDEGGARVVEDNGAVEVGRPRN